MSPGASMFHLPHGRHDHDGVASAMAVAILFVMVAAISFAVDQSVTLSSLPPPPAASTGR
jgi:hypothetical protein